MKTKRFLKILFGRDKIFYERFERISSNLIDISRLLTQLVNSNSADRRQELANEIDKLEDTGDHFAHEMFNEVSTNLITPFDREDIHALISAIDDVVDYVHGSAKRITMYKDYPISPAMQNLAELILKGALELHTAVKGLRNISDRGKINEACAHIKSFEFHADTIFYAEMSTLFQTNTNGAQVLKVMEILQNLETATDMCLDAAKVIGTILMKNS